MKDTLLQVNKLSKYFGQHQVLKEVSFSLKPGEILGLVGANGSGKSTLCNCIFGHEKIRDTGGISGDIRLNNQIINHDQAMSYERGIGMVHQEFALFSDLTVEENIKLCNEHTNPFNVLDTAKNKEDASKILKELKVSVDLETRVKNTSIDIQQFIEIGRELDRQQLKLLILDEPTAVLNQKDSQQLISILKQLANKGIAIIFISHRLEEIMDLCHRIVVLRDGVLIEECTPETTCPDKLAELMIGQEVSKTKVEQKQNFEQVLMSFENYKVPMVSESLKKLNLDIYNGEILGVTSLSGHGKLAIGKGLMGLAPAEGKLIFRDEEISNFSYADKIKKGLYVLCEDRKHIGLLLESSIEENVIFTTQQLNKQFSKKLLGGLISWTDRKEVCKKVKEYVADLEIICQNIHQPVRELSGGNQQKVCLARSMALAPKLLFIAEPTRGIDIAAKEKVLKSLVEMNNENETTIVMISSELDELKRICNRIVVLCEGRVQAILPATASAKDFGLALSGGYKSGI